MCMCTCIYLIMCIHVCDHVCVSVSVCVRALVCVSVHMAMSTCVCGRETLHIPCCSVLKFVLQCIAACTLQCVAVYGETLHRASTKR